MSNFSSSLDDFFAIREREVLPKHAGGLKSLDEIVQRQKDLSHRQSAGATLEYIASTTQTGVLSTNRLSMVYPRIEEFERLTAAGATVVLLRTVESEDNDPLEEQIFHENLVDQKDVPFGLTSSKVDPRGDVERALGAGFSYLTVGMYLALRDSPRVDPLKVFADQAYQLRLTGALSQLGVNVVAEVVGGSFDPDVPPAMSIAMAVLESVFAVGCGNRNLVLRYSSLGNVVQDVAAMHVMRDIAKAEFADDVTVYVSAATWPGELPSHVGEAYAALSAGAMAAGLGGADLGAVDRLRGEEFDEWEDHVSAVQAERQLLDMLEGQALENSDELSLEESDLRDTVEAILLVVRGDESQTLHEQMMSSASRGLFSTGGGSIDFAVARDGSGAVRWIEKGEIPVPPKVLERDRRLLDSMGETPFEMNLIRRYVARDSKS